MQIGAVAIAWALAVPLGAQGLRQTSQDEYTLHELLAPDTASFRIDYEVTATTAGATSFFNPIRKGSVAAGRAGGAVGQVGGRGDRRNKLEGRRQAFFLLPS